jgi:hypothetical protein
MSDLEQAATLVGKITSDIRKAELEVERLVRVKREPALQAAKGDAKAGKRLGELNDRLRLAELHKEDLASALEQARAELVELERAEQRVRDLARANQIEATTEELLSAAIVADEALADLTRALAARDTVARRLVELMPGALGGADLSHRLCNPNLLVRAARRHGLGPWLRLGFAEAHHCTRLRDLHPLPEVGTAVRRLRAEPGQKAA